MSESLKTLGIDGLIEFGEYLNSLQDRGYTFDMEDARGRLVEHDLNEVIREFQDFCNGKGEKFHLAVTYVDSPAGVICRIDRSFTRRKQT